MAFFDHEATFRVLVHSIKLAGGMLVVPKSAMEDPIDFEITCDLDFDSGHMIYRLVNRKMADGQS